MENLYPPLLMMAGEASSDQYGAALARLLKKDFPGLSIFGVGGRNMREAGVETLVDVSAINTVGIIDVFTKVPSYLIMMRRILRVARERGVRVVVLIDAPGFNLFFIHWAKRAGLRIIYYVSPQIWAFSANRLRLMKRIDKMLTMFPFEVPLYTAVGIEAEYVGHPSVDRLLTLPEPHQVAQNLGLDLNQPILALLPGSRRQEIARLLDPMLEALTLIRKEIPKVQAILPAASTVITQIKQKVCQFSGDLKVVDQQSAEALQIANFALVASGTITLEAGFIGTPMAIVYKIHWFNAWVARRLVRVPYVGLVNIVAERQIVPELLQEEASAASMAAMALEFLKDPLRGQKMKEELAVLRQILGQGGNSQRAALSVGKIIKASPHHQLQGSRNS